MKVKRIFAVLISFLSVFIFLFCGCKSKKMNLSEDLFDEKVLEYYNLSWLIKPEGAENEASVNEGTDDNPRHLYSCNIENYEQFTDYVSYVFNTLYSNNYHVARFVKLNNNWLRNFLSFNSWDEVASSENRDEYSRSYVSNGEDYHEYIIYFSAKKLGKYEDEYHGKKMKGASRFCLSYKKYNDGKIDFSIFIYRPGDVYLITDEQYLKSIKK